MKCFDAKAVAVGTMLALVVGAAPALADETKCAPAPSAVVSDGDSTLAGSGFVATLGFMGRVEDASSFSLDKLGTSYSHAPALNTTLRVGMSYNSKGDLLPLFLKVDYSHDLLAGVIAGGAQGDDLVHGPNTGGYDDHALRKAFILVAAGNYLAMGAGVTTSHWGLGLIANGGENRAAPGSASFTDPRGGDTVLRVLVATGPYTDQGLQLFVGADQVVRDDVLLDGDEAHQLIAGIKLGAHGSYAAGMYGVYRSQKTVDGKRTRVAVVDGYAKIEHSFSPYLRVTLEGEGAVIFGKTDLGPSPDFPEHDVLQIGGALRLSIDANHFGGVLDVLYASGDRDFEDKQQNAFKADINYEMGLLLFRHVMAAQSARFPETASDEDLSGYPPEDLDRLPTRGAVSNTLAIYPRLWWRPMDGLELYGGPLLAFSAVDFSDPLNTKLAGGANRNPLDGVPGGYLGTEFDLGLRYHALIAKTRLNLGVEGAVFLPGDAFADSAGGSLGTVYGGRVLATYNF